MRIVTWNLLHRIHAMNWSEPAIAAYPDEAVRIAAITETIRGFGADVVCLQEVSGDQLASLRAAFAEVHVHTYPRVPRLKRADLSSPLGEPAEHLVTLAAGRTVASETFPTDRGKGFLVVEVGDLAVINTHVSYGPHHAAQCAQLASTARAFPAAVILGDFNEDRAVCGERLGGGFVPAMPAHDVATRPRTEPKLKSEIIDHVFVSGCTASAVSVLAVGGLSDHHPVGATIVR